MKINALEAVAILDEIPLDDDSREALLLGVNKALENEADHIGTEDYLYGLLHIERIRNILEQLGIDSYQRLELINQYLSIDDRSPETQKGYTETALRVLEAASKAVESENQSVANVGKITPVLLLLSILKERFGGAVLLLLNNVDPGSQEQRENVQTLLADAIKNINDSLR